MSLAWSGGPAAAQVVLAVGIWAGVSENEVVTRDAAHKLNCQLRCLTMLRGPRQSNSQGSQGSRQCMQRRRPNRTACRLNSGNGGLYFRAAEVSRRRRGDNSQSIATYAICHLPTSTMKAYSLTAFTISYLASVRAFVPQSVGHRPATSGERYGGIFYVNDDHHRDVEASSEEENGIVPAKASAQSSSSLQHEPPFLALLETEDNWKEWHYSFSRNGLTDFLPQFSDHITCCLIGGGDGNDNGVVEGHSLPGTSKLGSQLPWQVDSDAGCTITRGVDADQSATTDTNLQHKSNAMHGKLSTATTSIIESDEKGFDCILDGGVMNAVMDALPENVTWHSRAGPKALLELHSLMSEANAAIREFGIYVAITDGPVPNHAKEYLVAMGEVMGMQWKFELDGLSSEDYCVSVARKYYNGIVNLENEFSSGTENKDSGRLLP